MRRKILLHAMAVINELRNGYTLKAKEADRLHTLHHRIYKAYSVYRISLDDMRAMIDARKQKLRDDLEG